MRFADLLVDLAAVASASRSVASKHVALRARQVDRYGKTSSIIAAAKEYNGVQGRSEEKPKSRHDVTSQSREQGADEITNQTSIHIQKRPLSYTNL